MIYLYSNVNIFQENFPHGKKSIEIAMLILI